MARKTIAQLEAELAQVGKPIVSWGDPRLAKLWEDAHTQANEDELCEDYDNFVEAIGGPPRMRGFYGSITVYFNKPGVAETHDAKEVLEDIALAIKGELADGITITEVEADRYSVDLA
jgi:hypothetical protein